MNIFQRVIIEPFEQFYEKVIQFLPNFLTSLLILIIGIILGRILNTIFLKIFRTIGLDKFSEKSGVIDLIRKGGIKDSVSVLFSISQANTP